MEQTLNQFANGNLLDASKLLLGKLSIKHTQEEPTPIRFKDYYDREIPQYIQKVLALTTEIYYVGEVCDDSLNGIENNTNLAEDIEKLQNNSHYQSMMLFAVNLSSDYVVKRKDLTDLIRAFNRLVYSFPVTVIFRQGHLLSIGTCERTQYKQEWREGEKIGKVFLLHNINCNEPERGHLNILYSMTCDACATFDKLYEKWQKVFNTKTLTDKFYKELYSWYMWVVNDPNTHFPENDHLPEHENEKKNVKIIRLITRLLFVWFIKAKKVKQKGQPDTGLVPEKLFEIDKLKAILNDFDPNSATDGEFYNAILQNLFFATLNNEVKSRRFVDTSNAYRSKKGYTVKNLYRDNKDKSGSWFKISHDEVLDLFKTVPFLNCGLFECLDKYKRTDINYDVDRLFDGFSTKSGDKFRACVPNRLFFANELPEITIQVTEKGKKVPLKIKSKGLINLLNEYVFTVEENTPLDQQVSLDPELLGKVFENLLAAYNPETEESARKSSGSYYTPREIVEYMVNESLIQYLKTNLNADEATEKQLRNLVNPSNPDFELSSNQQDAILEALYHCRILDPACGSGAFPMGILQQMVHIIGRLDDNNEKWQKLITKKATEETAKAYENKELDDDERKKIIADIESSFTNSKNNPDYTRKLYLIQNCIFGVDIQPIAMMISKLRFFISLICEQDENAIDFDKKERNFGIHTLPNLETKFVAANSLLTPDVKKFTGDWTNDEHLDQLKDELMELRYRHVTARSLKDKMEIRTLDDEKRQEINDYILSTQAHADPVKIAMFEDQIAHLMLERKLYEGENIVEEYVDVQGDLFADSERKLVRKDANRAKRDEIDRQIHICQAQIDHEKAKENITGFEAAVKQLTEWNPYDQVKSSPFFDPDWMFGVSDGFDIVIGNPPYISYYSNTGNKLTNEERRFLVDNYDTVLKPNDRINSMNLMIERGVRLLKEKKHLSYIVNKTVAVLPAYITTREFILDNAQIAYFIPELSPFEAIVDCVIIGLNKKDSQSYYQLQLVDKTLSKSSLITPNSFKNNRLFEFVYSKFETLLSHIEQCENKLSDYLTVNRGVNIGGCSELFLSQHKTSSLYRKYLPGTTNVKQYSFIWREEDGYMKLDKNLESQLKQQGKTLALGDPERYNKERIIIPESSQVITAAYCDEDYYTGYGLMIGTAKDKSSSLLYLCGILNSKIISFYAIKKEILRKGGKATPHVGTKGLLALPIPECKPLQKRIENNVKYILGSKKTNPQTDTRNWEEEIDAIVYALYGLNYEEVMLVEQEKIIDRKFKLTKEAYEKLLAEK